jgi:hypothetical protein
LKHSQSGYFTENGNFQVEQSLFRPEHKPKRGQYQAGYPKIHRGQELMGQKIIQGTRQAWQGLSASVESEGMHELCTYSVDIQVDNSVDLWRGNVYFLFEEHERIVTDLVDSKRNLQKNLWNPCGSA